MGSGLRGDFQDRLFQPLPGAWDENERGLLAEEYAESSRMGKSLVLASGIPGDCLHAFHILPNKNEGCGSCSVAGDHWGVTRSRCCCVPANAFKT